MKYIQHQTGCSADLLTVAETQIPSLQPGQVLVKVECFGINRADTLQRQGKYPAPKGESPILGLEVSGEVIECHAQQSSNICIKTGDKVFGLVAGGGYAEYVAVQSEHLMHVPEGINMIQAAGIAECFLTAYQVMFLESSLQSEQNILIHAGASGVGLAATQLAKQRGCQVAVTASSEAKLTTCKTAGADLLINYKQQDFYQQISEQWAGCDLIIDFVGGDYVNRNLKLLKLDGTIIYLAMLAGRYADTLDMAMLLGKRATIKGSTLRNRSNQYKQQLVEQFSHSFLPYFSSGKLIANIDTEYSAKDIGLTHQRMENNDTKGKLICRW